MKRSNQEHETTAKQRARYVWHICRYRQRFEMPDQYRRQMTGPLEFARDFIGSNAGMEAAKYQQQVNLLGEGREATLRFGLFRQLVGLASNQDRPYRGYLLDADCQPLNDFMLARLLKWELAELRQELRELAAAGLIERVQEPHYIEQDRAHLPPEGESEEERQTVRGSAQNCAEVRAPSRRRIKREPKPKKKNEKRNPKENLERVPQSQDTTENRMKAQAEGESVSGPGGPYAPVPSQETPKPERNPKESEGEGVVSAHAQRPPHSARTGETSRLGKIPIWWSDPACKAFSYAIFRELKLSMDPEGKEGKSQRGTFAAWLFEARARVPMTDWKWLEEKALAKAREIARYGKGARKPGAVWLKVMRSELQARAGPAATMSPSDVTRGNTTG